MNTCPCCRERLICQVSRSRIYWFCPHCWQEMPIQKGMQQQKKNYIS
ncbi:hypothetical protein Dacsa_0902 [Dactylococcopsis salina PCC 8305]|uniref:Uncharacterized protein n=1 Tax=Dactylococcopsis salina (strain PCC 8305) TaxID=13035 RepID=K9YTE5_DACS8|nr:hypothetical protein Dacsa_0902 [Dactylococcopsis salina PCC 8305]